MVMCWTKDYHNHMTVKEECKDTFKKRDDRVKKKDRETWQLRWTLKSQPYPHRHFLFSVGTGGLGLSAQGQGLGLGQLAPNILFQVWVLARSQPREWSM